MTEDTTLLTRIFKAQLEPIMNGYMRWITPHAHETAVPKVKTFTYSVEQGALDWEKSYVFTLNYHGRNIKFTFLSNGHGECLSVNMDFCDVNFVRDQMAIVNELTYEIYNQLNAYAFLNKIPPRRIL